MSEDVKVPEVEVDNEPKPLNPIDFLATFPNAPTKENIDFFKSSAPGGRIKLFTSSDMKRVYLMRGISAFEMQKLQEGILNTVKESSYETELQVNIATKCCLWTSVTKTGKLSEIDIKGSGAGLAVALYQIVAELSDYVSPDHMSRFSAEL